MISLKINKHAIGHLRTMTSFPHLSVYKSMTEKHLKEKTVVHLRIENIGKCIEEKMCSHITITF